MLGAFRHESLPHALSAHRPDRQRVEQNRAAQTSVRTAIWQRADGVAETDCVAGVIGLEL